MTREEKIEELRSLASGHERNSRSYEVQAEALEASGLSSSFERDMVERHKVAATAYLDHAMRLACEEEA